MRAREEAKLTEQAEVTRTPRALPAKVRQTVDLTGEADAAFAAWRLDAALNLGRRRLTTQAALAALVDVLLADQQVARRVLKHLEDLDQQAQQ